MKTAYQRLALIALFGAFFACEPGLNGVQDGDGAEPAADFNATSRPASTLTRAQAAAERWQWGFADESVGGNGEKSFLGESCGWSGDCRADMNLVCVAQTCVSVDKSEETTPEDREESLRRSGVVGESCLARSDCELGLACVGGTCVPATSLQTQTDAGVADLAVGSVGESCSSRDDCVQGLACVNQVCAVSTAGLIPNDNECVVVECHEPIDCCPPSGDNCAELQAACEESEPDSLICSRFEASCRCDGSLYACEDGSCNSEFTCSDVLLCPGLMVCDSGTCVRCVADSDCPGAARCSNNECAQACEKDSECGRFHQCQDGACVDVGCQTDRECKAFLNNPHAVCADATCSSTCSTDLNCGAAEGSNQLCFDGTCVDAGCETDQECRIRQEMDVDVLLGLEERALAVECRSAGD